MRWIRIPAGASSLLLAPYRLIIRVYVRIIGNEALEMIMPLFKVDIQKLYEGEFWTNRYIVNTSDIETAANVGAAIANFERNIHSSAVSFDRYRVSDNVPNTDVFYSFPLIGFGELQSASDPLPLFNVLRVDFGVGPGRPSRKYFRVGLGATWVQGSEWHTDLITAAQTFGSDLLGLGALVDPQGTPWISVAARRSIGMRQLRRGTRQRTQPVI